MKINNLTKNHQISYLHKADNGDCIISIMKLSTFGQCKSNFSSFLFGLGCLLTLAICLIACAQKRNDNFFNEQMDEQSVKEPLLFDESEAVEAEADELEAVETEADESEAIGAEANEPEADEYDAAVDVFYWDNDMIEDDGTMKMPSDNNVMNTQTSESNREKQLNSSQTGGTKKSLSDEKKKIRGK